MNVDLRSINKCVRCGTCRSVCPIFEDSGWESANTRGRIMIIKGLAEGREADASAVDSLSTCTTCGLCTECCPAGVNPPELIEASRRDLVSRGMVTERQALLNRKVIESGNTFGEESDRLAWLQDRRPAVQKSDYVYFVGCLASYRYPEIAARTFEVLRRFGVALLPDEQCCGSPLMRTGFDYSRLKEHNIQQIRDMGAHTVITGCAGCYTALKRYGCRDFRVVSVPEFLAEHLSELKLQPLDLKVTYHDPCHLGRHARVYDQPRQVIKAICELEEMAANRSSSRCCGGGGGVRSGYGELSLRLAKKRLEDVPGDVDYVVTSCPLCIRNLTDAGAEI
ncbi:MAG: (Fe-S)-binding protein, partial [Methanosarcinales archaeon]|nr:(Fe-S)-binding protein [Methanosarcinales archaeon]